MLRAHRMALFSVEAHRMALFFREFQFSSLVQDQRLAIQDSCHRRLTFGAVPPLRAAVPHGARVRRWRREEHLGGRRAEYPAAAVHWWSALECVVY